MGETINRKIYLQTSLHMYCMLLLMSDPIAEKCRLYLHIITTTKSDTYVTAT